MGIHFLTDLFALEMRAVLSHQQHLPHDLEEGQRWGGGGGWARNTRRKCRKCSRACWAALHTHGVCSTAQQASRRCDTLSAGRAAPCRTNTALSPWLRLKAVFSSEFIFGLIRLKTHMCFDVCLKVQFVFPVAVFRLSFVCVCVCVCVSVLLQL